MFPSMMPTPWERVKSYNLLNIRREEAWVSVHTQVMKGGRESAEQGEVYDSTKFRYSKWKEK